MLKWTMTEIGKYKSEIAEVRYLLEQEKKQNRQKLEDSFEYKYRQATQKIKSLENHITQLKNTLRARTTKMNRFKYWIECAKKHFKQLGLNGMASHINNQVRENLSCVWEEKREVQNSQRSS